MAESSASQNPERQARLESVLAAYLHATDKGQPPDRQALIAANPGLADDLRSFFHNCDTIQRLADPLPAVDAATLLGMPGLAAAQPGSLVRYFGNYELLEEIARGGMGVVYRARQVNLNRVVALKMILAGQLANPEEVRRFQSEAEAAARLDHPGIVPIFEIGEHEGQHFFSMGFVEGMSLGKKLADGPLPAREAAALVKSIAEAVDYAHQHGIIHRDLKPANVLLDRMGQPRVTDFGLAKQMRGDSGQTEAGQILGTPSYMPPEQAAGRIGQIGPAADVYSLGAILYCLLTGRPPFQASSPMDTLLQVLDQEPVPLRRLNAGVPLDLETIALHCLQKDPTRRYATAKQLADELQRHLEGRPIAARPVSALRQGWLWCRRKPVIAGLSAGVLALLLVIATAGPLVAIRQAELRSAAVKKEGEAQTARNAAQIERNAARKAESEAQLQTLSAYRNLAESQFARAATLRLAAEVNRQGTALDALRRVQQLRTPMEELSRLIAARDAKWSNPAGDFWTDMTPRLRGATLGWLTEGSLQNVATLSLAQPVGTRPGLELPYGNPSIKYNPAAETVLAPHPVERLVARSRRGVRPQIELIDLDRRITLRTIELEPISPPNPPEARAIYGLGLGFSTDGTQLFIAWIEGRPTGSATDVAITVQVCESSTGKTLRHSEFPLPPGQSSSERAQKRVVFSRDASRVVICPVVSVVENQRHWNPSELIPTRVYDVPASRELFTVTEGGFFACGFTPLSNKLYGYLQAGEIGTSAVFEIRDPQSGASLQKVPLGTVRLTPEEVAMSPDEGLLAFAQAGYNRSLAVHILELATGRPLCARTLRADVSENDRYSDAGVPQNLLSFSPDGRTLGVITPDKIHILSVPEGLLLASQPHSQIAADGNRNFGNTTFGQSTRPRWVPACLTFVGNGSTIVTVQRIRQAETEELLQLWDAAGPRFDVARGMMHNAPIKAAAVSPDETVVYLAETSVTAVSREARPQVVFENVPTIEGDLDSGRVAKARDAARWVLPVDRGPDWRTDRYAGRQFDPDHHVGPEFSAGGRLYIQTKSAYPWTVAAAYSTDNGRLRTAFDSKHLIGTDADLGLLAFDKPGVRPHLEVIVSDLLAETVGPVPQGMEFPVTDYPGVQISPNRRYVIGRTTDKCWCGRMFDGSIVARIPCSPGFTPMFSPTGDRLLVIGPQPAENQPSTTFPAVIVDLETGSTLGTIKLRRSRWDRPGNVAWSADGQTLAFVSAGLQTGDLAPAHVEIWRAGRPDTVRVPRDWTIVEYGGSEIHPELKLSDDGLRLMVTGPDHEPMQRSRVISELWLLEEMQRIFSSADRAGSCSKVRMSPNGAVALDFHESQNGGSTLRCEIVSLKTGKTLREFPNRPSVEMSPDGTYLLMGTYSRPVSGIPITPSKDAPAAKPELPQKPAAPEHNGMLLAEMTSGQTYLEFPSQCYVRNFSADSERLVRSYSNPVTLAMETEVWHLPSKSAVSIPCAMLNTANSAGEPVFRAFSPDGKKILCHDVEGLKVWDLVAGAALKNIPLRLPTTIPGLAPPNLQAVAWSGDSQRLALNVNGQVRLVNLEAPSLVPLPRLGHAAAARCIAISSNGQLVATGGDDRTVGLWHAADGGYAGMLEGYRSPVVGIAFHPQDPLLFTRDLEGNVVAWHIDQSGEGLAARIVWRAIVGPGSLLVVSPDGRTLATNGSGQSLLLATDDGRILRRLPQPAGVSGLAFQSDSQVVATASVDGLARLWEVASGKPVAAWDAGQGELTAIAFAPRGGLLVTAGINLRLWDSRRTRLEMTLERHTKSVRDLKFSRDGHKLISVGDDQLMVDWDLKTLNQEFTKTGLGWND